MDPYNTLSERIRGGTYRSGDHLASERSLAEECGVDRGTVRRAIARLAHEGFLERRPGCRPVVLGTPAPPNGEASIALIISSEDPFRGASLVVRGCEAELREAGFRLIYINTWAPSRDVRLKRERDALDDLLQHPTSGLIIWSHEPARSLPILEELHKRGMAIVAIDRHAPSAAVDFVGLDNGAAAGDVADHLYRLGHRRMAVAAPEGDNTFGIPERVHGFLAALRRHGSPSAEDVVFRLPLGSPTVATDAMRPGTFGPEGVSAILAVTDDCSSLAAEAVNSLGLRVPDDVSIIGFGDIDAPLVPQNRFGQVRQGFERLGQYAARLVLRRIKDPGRPPQQVLLQATIEDGATVRPITQAIDDSTPSDSIQPRMHEEQTEMPIGLYALASPGRSACGLATRFGIIGYLHDPASFYYPERADAEIIWASEGFVEYRFPNKAPDGAGIERLEVSFEACAETANYDNDFPSDITVWVNGHDIGTWTCPGDFGGRRGRLNPGWWSDWFTQYGMLKTWTVDHTGCRIDGVLASDATIADLCLEGDFISLRIGVKPEAAHQGGFNLFGRGFGDHEQDITLSQFFTDRASNGHEAP